MIGDNAPAWLTLTDGSASRPAVPNGADHLDLTEEQKATMRQYYEKHKRSHHKRRTP
jgi:hypothetical protein